MHKLDSAHLFDSSAELPATLLRPGYDRRALRAGIAHIGVGGFHRAHQAIYLDRCLARPGHEAWGLCGINLLPQDAAMAAAMRRQDGLYTVTEMAPDGTHRTRLVEAMIEYLYAPDDPQAVLARLAHPDIRIVSLTITEGGYLLDEQGRFKREHPAIAHDLAHPGAPQSVFGFLVEALARRRAAGVPPFTVMSCDNLRHNGAQARRACVAFAGERDAGLAAWIEREVSFPSGMVDRITPATDEVTRQKLRALSGVDDAAPVICEDFIQWVLEDDFRNGRPDWAAAGVMLTDDVSPYEEAKIRLLNASHTMLSYPAHLSGYRKVDEALRDPLFRDYLRAFLDHDAGPFLRSLPGLDLATYKETLLRRFSNRAIGDQLARLCSDGASKIPGFLLPTVHACLEHGRPYHRLAFLLACYHRHLAGVDEHGEHYALSEPNAGRLLDAVRASGVAADLLAVSEIVGTRLPQHAGFVTAYLELRARLDVQGVTQTLREVLGSQPAGGTSAPSA